MGRLLSKDRAFYDYGMQRMKSVTFSNEKYPFELNIFWIRYICHDTVSKMGRVHSHSFYELHCVLNGRYEYISSDGKRACFSGGEFVLVTPNTRHCINALEENSETFAIAFEPMDSYNPQVLKLVSVLQMYPYFVKEIADGCIGLIETIMEELYYGHMLYDKNINLLCSMLVVNILRGLMPEEVLLPLLSKNMELFDYRLKEIEQLIMDNPERCFSVAELAQYLNISSKHLNHLVHDNLGISTKHFVDKTKLKLAKKLLLDTDISVCQISSMLGFEDNNNFNRFFKRLEGMAPGAFRRAKGKK